MDTPYVRNDIEKFRLVVEELEVCREMIKSASHVKSRTALILMDNLAEILAIRIYEAAFKRDNTFALVERPRINFAEIRDAKGDFSRKISLLEKLGAISKYDASVLRVSHQYRNAAFHRDTHNVSIIRSLAMVCFRSVCHLFVVNYNIGVSYGGMESLRWLVPYAKNTTRLNFREDSQIIADKLLRGITKSAATLRKHFAKDILERLKDIGSIRNEIGYGNPDLLLNEFLRLAEFDEEHPFAKYVEYYAFTRSLATAQLDSLKVQGQLFDLKEKADKKMEEDLKLFKATVSTKILDEAVNFLRRSESLKSADKILFAYQQLDFKLSRFEYYLWKLEIEWDERVQMEIDFARGK